MLLREIIWLEISKTVNRKKQDQTSLDSEISVDWANVFQSPGSMILHHIMFSTFSVVIAYLFQVCVGI